MNSAAGTDGVGNLVPDEPPRVLCATVLITRRRRCGGVVTDNPEAPVGDRAEVREGSEAPYPTFLVCPVRAGARAGFAIDCTERT